MKIYLALLALAAMAGNATHAQDVNRTFVIHPYSSNGKLSPSRFWTPSTIALIAVDGAAKAADSYATRMNIDGGGVEFNPLARPFVHTTGVQVSATVGMLGAEVATAYVLHRWRHDNLAHSVLASGAIINGLGAASSIKHRVADW